MLSPSHSTYAEFGNLKLLPEDLLVRTGPVDHADWNYRGLLGAIQRRRFNLVKQTLDAPIYDDLLEVGYGSGVFAPELARRCLHYYGIDIHAHSDRVATALHSVGIECILRQGSLTSIPFESASFDCVVGVSVLEFVDDQVAACREIHRVLKTGGVACVVTPGYSKILDLGLKVLTGESAENDYDDRRQRVIPALKGRFEVVRSNPFPSPTLFGVHWYETLLLRKT